MSTPPNYPGVDTFDQPLVDAWWTPGWSAQNKAYQVAPPQNGVAPGAPPVTYVNVSHSYFDEDGSSISGFLTFQPSDNASLTIAGTTWRLPARLAGTATWGPYATGYGWHQNSSGSIYIWRGGFYVSLMPTDLAGLVTDSGVGYTYTVIEHFLGGQKFQIQVPGASSNPVDLYSLIVPGSITPYQYDPTNVLADESELTAPPSPSPWNDAGVVIDGGQA